MGGQKSEPINLTTEPNQSETNQPKQPTDKRQTPDNRQLGLLFRLLLHISISPYLYAYLRAYLCRLFACLCSRIPTQWPLRTYTSPYLPSPIWERESLGSLSSIFFWIFFREIFLAFFWNFFFEFFFAEFHKALFMVVGIFERVHFLS